VVPGEDVDAVADALVGLLTDRRARELCRDRSTEVAARFRWSIVLEPLVAFCAEPRRAPDLPGWAVAGGAPPAGGVTEVAPTGLARYRTGVVRLYAERGVRGVVSGAFRRLRHSMGRR
jgi:hypothetical protein